MTYRKHMQWEVRNNAEVLSPGELPPTPPHPAPTPQKGPWQGIKFLLTISLQVRSSINDILSYLLLPWVSQRNKLLWLSVWKGVSSKLNWQTSVSGPVQEKLGSHHSILTTSTKLNKLKKNPTALPRSLGEVRSQGKLRLQMGGTDRQIQWAPSRSSSFLGSQRWRQKPEE